MKNESPTTLASPSALKSYFLAARPKTWIASLSPVFIGVKLAPTFNPFIFILTLLFSLFIQIGTNYANDYFDFCKGADNTFRIGPLRATQQGWISPASMLRASFFAFACALFFAIPLMIKVGFWSLPLAAFCILFGILYTAGPKPLGYLGLGEVLVFFFFGPFAGCGTYYLQTGSLSFSAFLASLPPGLLSCSILIANNLRDQKTDSAAGKKTLIVRFGKTFGAIEYTSAILLAVMISFFTTLSYIVPLTLLLASLPSIKRIFTFKIPLEVVPVLGQSAFLLFLYTALFIIASR